MTLNSSPDRFFPYPRDMRERAGYAIADIVSLAIVVLIMSAVLRV
jgi:hypothetical protein